MLNVTREAFRKYLVNRDKPWKYEAVADEIRRILKEDEYNDRYGRYRMYQALLQRAPEWLHIPSERTVYHIMQEMCIIRKPKHKSNVITKADREARKSYDLLRRDFRSDKPLIKAITDITEIKARDGKLYISAIFDCYDAVVLGLAMDTNMKARYAVIPLATP